MIWVSVGEEWVVWASAGEEWVGIRSPFWDKVGVRLVGVDALDEVDSRDIGIQVRECTLEPRHMVGVRVVAAVIAMPCRCAAQAHGAHHIQEGSVTLGHGLGGGGVMHGLYPPPTYLAPMEGSVTLGHGLGGGLHQGLRANEMFV